MRRPHLTPAIYSWVVMLFALAMLQPWTLTTAAMPPAQGRGVPDTPPVASLISISAPDANGLVTIEGAAGSVQPVAQVVIKNLSTEQTAYVNAGFNGSFSVNVFGPGDTPFWISTAPEIPGALRNLPGSLPGGPGTIIRSGERTIATTQATQIMVDGNLGDWAVYPQAGSDGVFALQNQEAFYVGVRAQEFLTEFAAVRLTIRYNTTAEYAVTIDHNAENPVTVTNIVNVRQNSPTRRDRGGFAANVTLNSVALEARLPLAINDAPFETASLVSVTLLDANGGETHTIQPNQPFLRVEEITGALYPDGVLAGDSVTPFFASGALGQGASVWYANGRANDLTFSAGDQLVVEMDVTALTPNLPLEITDLTFIGELGLQPVNAASLYSNNGWSNVLTPSGLAIDNLTGDVFLQTISVDWSQVTRMANRLIFGMRFSTTLPRDLPDGLYVPYFKGTLQTPDGASVAWVENSPLSQGTAATDSSTAAFTRLPLVFNVGEQTEPETRLPMVLFYDDPSDGSRGVLAEADQEIVALSNRVRFNSPTYILPPGIYPVEPYLPTQLANTYDISLAPLLPLSFPSGRINAQVIRPDGTRENLGAVPVLQNRLSTTELNESTRFGRQSPVDVYRLTTLSPGLTEYGFDAYGEYLIEMSARIDDIFGNTYVGGGQYSVLIAELLDMTPGVLSGTPFEVGDAFFPGLHVLPGYAADVTVTVRHYPLSGDMIEQTFSGQADRHGFYVPADGAFFRFESPGQYVVDYDARYTDVSGRLWAASLRGAGVVADPKEKLVAHGRRGLANYVPRPNEPLPAWYNTRLYPPSRNESTFIPSILNAPYHSGDVAVYADSATSGIRPALQVQDISQEYADWLHGTLPDYVSPSGQALDELIRRDSLPLLTVLGGVGIPYGPSLAPELIVNQAYSYFSAVRPNITIRQFVQGGGENNLIPLHWDAEDPLNRQIGAGINGDRPGDFTFVFGGAVVSNAEAGINTAAIYGSLAVVTRENDALGPRVYPPYRGEAGGVDSGPLITARGVEYASFFVPTGTQPGQVVDLGTPLVIAGQAAPVLKTQITVIVKSPSGVVRQFDGLSNSIGSFYDPGAVFALDEIGIWSVRINISPAGDTSAGEPEAPFPVGGIIGAPDGLFDVYVVDPETPPLNWNRNGDIDTVTPAAQPFNFTVNVPPGMQDVVAYRTTWIEGTVLDAGPISNVTGTASYQFNPAGLAQEFANLEANGRGNSASASDVVTVTLAVNGTDGSGAPLLSTRTFYILHDRIISVEDE